MSDDPNTQERAHDAAPFGGMSPADAGALGARVREDRRRARLEETRERLEQLGPDAVQALGEVLTGERRPAVTGTATAILDRIGLGPSSKTEVTVGPSEALLRLIQEVDATPEGSTIHAAPEHVGEVADNGRNAADSAPNTPTPSMHRPALLPRNTPRDT